MSRPRRGHDESDSPERECGLTPEIAAEASVWIARLHGPGRSSRMERECLDWQARSAAHRFAFERCTEVWQAVPQLSLADAYSFGASQHMLHRTSIRAQRAQRAQRVRWTWTGVMLTIMVIGLALLLARITPDYATGVGEQRSVVLADGTLLWLNTDTRVNVDMTPALRSVRVLRGEALFEVAKDASRPFVVHAWGSDVVALGTAFAVRLTDPSAQVTAALAVTLIEGSVTVRPTRGQDEPKRIASSGEIHLRPGDRLRLTAPAVTGMSAAPNLPSVRRMPVNPIGTPEKAGERPSTALAAMTLDRPEIDQLMAWKRSEVVFDDTSLPEAVSEMNRYNRVPIVLAADPALSQLRVSGAYRAVDGDGFARAAATLHGLVVRRRDGRLELLRPQ